MKPYGRGHFDHDCCKPFFFQGNKHGVLLLHGFTGSVAHMRPLGDALRNKGYTVMGINLPGHALDERAMAASSWQQWLQAAKEAVVKIKETCSIVTVCGLSMGGILCLLMAEQMQIDACIPISAPMPTQSKLIYLAGLLAPVYPRISGQVPEKRCLELDPAYDYAYCGYPTQKAADLNHLIRLSRQNLSAVSCPILCVQSDADHTIASGSTDYILNNVSSKIRQKILLRGVPHTCTISKALPILIAGTLEFLEGIHAKNPSNS